MTILVINSGSSSIKFALFDNSAQIRVADGSVVRIGETASELRVRADACAAADDVAIHQQAVDDHDAGLQLVFEALDGAAHAAPGAIGHRVVHGGAAFSQPARIDERVLSALRELEPLAPMHNPANLRGIEVALRRFPVLPQVAVFDTAFHQSMPEHAWRYALPDSVSAKHQIRRYGFHGTSHAFLARRAAELLDRALHEINTITLHLGNGASAAAVRGGCSVDTSMGFTPLEGLMMGTRCGDLDPAVVLHLLRHTDMTPAEVDDLLNRASGLLGVAGDNDMRAVLRRRAAGDAGAALAFEMFCYRVRKYIGAYTAALGRVDALVFAGGIGAHQAAVRERCCADLGQLGIELDPAPNATAADGASVHSTASRVAIFVVHTDEEQEIARQTAATVGD